MNTCRKSCPEGCPRPAQLGPQASALVRDVWQEDDVGVFSGRCVGGRVFSGRWWWWGGCPGAGWVSEEVEGK